MTKSPNPASTLDVAEIVFAALGVYVLVGAVMSLEAIALRYFAEGPGAPLDRVSWLIPLVNLTVRLGVGVPLIVFRRALATRLGTDRTLPSLSRSDLLAIALAAVGAYLFVQGASRLGVEIIAWIEFNRWQQPVEPLLQTTLGAFLFLGARGVVGLWTRLRSSS